MYGLTPHLHLRGKSMKYTVTYPDGREEVLLDVPKYDFNWQIYYELTEPKQLPAGSKVTVTTLFDNSLKNPYNPAPHLEVNWSEQSWDEMYAPQVRMTVDSRDLRKPKATRTHSSNSSHRSRGFLFVRDRRSAVREPPPTTRVWASAYPLRVENSSITAASRQARRGFYRSGGNRACGCDRARSPQPARALRRRERR